MHPLLPTRQLCQYNESHVQTNSNTRKLNVPCSQVAFLLSTTILYKYLFILNPLVDVFSLHSGNTSITDQEVCFQRVDKGRAEPPHLLKGKPQGYTSRNIMGGKNLIRLQG